MESSFICIKRLCLGGVSYQQGDAIPQGAILPSRVRTLIKQGYIAAQKASPVQKTEGKARKRGEMA